MASLETLEYRDSIAEKNLKLKQSLEDIRLQSQIAEDIRNKRVDILKENIEKSKSFAMQYRLSEELREAQRSLNQSKHMQVLIERSLSKNTLAEQINARIANREMKILERQNKTNLFRLPLNAISNTVDRLLIAKDNMFLMQNRFSQNIINNQIEIQKQGMLKTQTREERLETTDRYHHRDNFQLVNNGDLVSYNNLNIDNYKITNEGDKTVYINKENSVQVEKNPEGQLYAKGGTVEQKVESLIEVAKQNGYDLSTVKVSGSKEFIAEVERQISKEISRESETNFAKKESKESSSLVNNESTKEKKETRSQSDERMEYMKKTADEHNIKNGNTNIDEKGNTVLPNKGDSKYFKHFDQMQKSERTDEQMKKNHQEVQLQQKQQQQHQR